MERPTISRHLESNKIKRFSEGWWIEVDTIAAITEENKPSATAWFDDQGVKDLVRSNVFHSDEEAREFVRIKAEQGSEYHKEAYAYIVAMAMYNASIK